LTKTIKAIENAVKSQAKLRKEFQLLKTIPGIGDILTLTIKRCCKDCLNIM